MLSVKYKIIHPILFFSRKQRGILWFLYSQFYTCSLLLNKEGLDEYKVMVQGDDISLFRNSELKLYPGFSRRKSNFDRKHSLWKVNSQKPTLIFWFLAVLITFILLILFHSLFKAREKNNSKGLMHWKTFLKAVSSTQQMGL